MLAADCLVIGDLAKPGADPNGDVAKERMDGRTEWKEWIGMDRSIPFQQLITTVVVRRLANRHPWLIRLIVCVRSAILSEPGPAMSGWMPAHQLQRDAAAASSESLRRVPGVQRQCPHR